MCHFDEKLLSLNVCKIVGRRARRLVAGAWLLSAIFSLPMVILYEEQVIQGNEEN